MSYTQITPAERYTLGLLRTQGFSELKPGRARHGMIGDDEIDLGFPHERERLARGAGFEHCMTEIFEHGRRIHEHETVVVDGNDDERVRNWR